MMNNDFFIMPPFLAYDNRPPTLYSLLESIVNYGKNEKTKIIDLAKAGRTRVFNFNYPLSDKVDKEQFETNILNHFLTRRIGQETFTAFQIQLMVKLNEIMPVYNSMFDMLSEWNGIEDIEIHKSTDNRITNKQDNSKTTNNIETNSNTNTETTQDKRFSELPQNEIENVKDGTYMTDYGLDNNISESHDNSNSTGTTNTEINQNTTDDNINNSETRKISPEKYFEYMEKMQGIYTLIYKKLDCIFYQLV